MLDDATLLRRYAENRSEGDFAELVRRHLNLVYSAALRQVNGDTHLAQDATQLVFTDLARKAAGLAGHRSLAGWLFTSTRFAAAKLVRGEQRRRNREQQAQLMQESDPSDSLDWERVRPVLDEALAEMDERDREAILLRYLEGCDFAQVGAKLALSDNAARMRVDRAVDKLRLLLARRGVTSTATALSLVLGSQAVVAAPTGLAAAVTGTALAGAGTAAAGAFTFMSLTKLQLGIASAAVVTGAGIYAVQEQANAALPVEPAKRQQESQSNRELEQAASRVADVKISEAELTPQHDKAVTPQPQPEATPRIQTASPTPETFSMVELDQKPVATFRKAPVYPYSMRRAGIGGKVTVSYVIGADGKVRDVQAVKSTTSGLSTWPYSDPTARHDFEMAAVAAVSEWRFDPGLKAGQKVNTRVSQVLEFKIPH